MQMLTFMQIIVLALGIKELLNANAYRKQQKKKWAVASLFPGVFACACAIISFTGVL